MRIGLLGYGRVAQDFLKLLYDKKYNFDVVFILKSNGGIENKKGLNIKELVEKTKDITKHENWIDNLSFEDVINDKIDILVELTSTNINDGQPAFTYIKEALNKRINVVTGNKGPILFGYNELKKIADKNGVFLGIDGTAGAALPSLNIGLNGCAGSEILSIEGVLNGTTNFILNEMEKEKISYQKALIKAQEIGIAEKDPTLDVEGKDTAAKFVILANALMGGELSLKDAEYEGITNICVEDIEEAKSKGQKIKLIGKAYRDGTKVKVQVKPIRINNDHPLYQVEGREKGIVFDTDLLGKIKVTGGTSGTVNAAAAILRDIINNIRR